MAITRAQLPEQIDVFQNGGDATLVEPLSVEQMIVYGDPLAGSSSANRKISDVDRTSPEIESLSSTTFDSIDTQANDLTKMFSNLEGRNEFDFSKSYNKYLDRLAPALSAPTKMSIFDFAAELGKGLAATPNVGGTSLYTGLSVGFTNVSDALRTRRENFEKERKAAQNMAIELALRDEQKAEEFLDEIALKMLDDTNSEIKTEFISYIDPNTKERVERILDKQSQLFRDIMADIETYKPMKINQPLMGGENKYEVLDKNTANAITDQENTWQEEANASYPVLDKLAAAEAFASQLREEDFGNVAVTFGVPIKNIMTGLGFGDLIDQERLGTQIAVNSVGTGLAMGLISQTKGAISDREMGMFLAASATLGNSKSGFLKILALTRKIAEKTVGYNDAWLAERNRLMQENKSVTEIRKAQANFQRKYHAENPLFEGSKREDGSDLYDPNASIEDNLKKFKEGTEAYEIMSQITQAGIDEYNFLKNRHSEISTRKFKNSQKGLVYGVEGVPDGSSVIQKRDGKTFYLKPGGDVSNPQDIIVKDD